MAHEDRIAQFKIPGSLVVQPGEKHKTLLETFGSPTFDLADKDVEKVVGAAQDVWRRAVYHANIPVNVPLGEQFTITHTNVVLSFQYHTDTGRIWGVGVRDYAGIFRNSIGVLDLSCDVTKAKEKLGPPKRSKRFSPPLILEEIIWESNGFIYVCEFYTEPHTDAPLTYKAGDMHSLDVISSWHAPEEYVRQLLNSK